MKYKNGTGQQSAGGYDKILQWEVGRDFIGGAARCPAPKKINLCGAN